MLLIVCTDFFTIQFVLICFFLGGSLAWLHGNKPYIRGGDFHPRQANGEHPKQLNYSRAFGGKDLKMFGRC